ncbi:VOC family protein [Actinophytocola sp.]|uniref:VOC family protein n=1 Tax=Actinophytocola sp. TaxID=1872138 RepID=UPI002D7FE164|nr:VOC family protein [Actinophytocola sp.]HET9139304.1 VOC family protein [Actinophytocola sp.]
MITGAHTIMYATDAEAARGFLRDVLGLSHVDAGDGWLIFRSPPAELAVHPAEQPGRHELYLMCDDLEATIADLTGKGVEFTGGISDQGWGRLTTLRVPGAGEIGLYQPRHPTAYDLT